MTLLSFFFCKFINHSFYFPCFRLTFPHLCRNLFLFSWLKNRFPFYIFKIVVKESYCFFWCPALLFIFLRIYYIRFRIELRRFNIELHAVLIVKTHETFLLDKL